MALLGAVEKGPESLRRQFPHVDAEAVSLLAGGEDGCEPEAEASAALAEMQVDAMKAKSYGDPGFLPTRECTVVRRCCAEGGEAEGTAAAEFELRFEGGGDPPRVGTVLVIGGLEECGREAAAVAIPDGRVLNLLPHPSSTCFLVSDYGMHELRFVSAEGKLTQCCFMATSHLGDFAEALDHFHDACDWVWDGNWTDELEEATMTMLGALDDYFTALEAMLQRSPLGETMRSEIGPSRRRLENSLAKALESHDAQSVGRIYGGVRSFLQSQGMLDMFGPMLGGGLGMGPLHESVLYKSVLGFEKARFATASEGKRTEVKGALARLIDAADAHAAALQGGMSSDFTSRWHGGLRDTFMQMRDDPEAVIHPLPFQQIRGGGSGHIAEMMKGMMDSFGGGGGTVQRSDTIEAVSMLKPESTFEEAEAKVSRWNESLVDEAVPFGSPLSPFTIHGNEPWVQTVMVAIQSILSLGLAYVSQGDEGASSSKLIALLDRDRATLPLSGHEEFLQDKKRRDRLKDVCRILRAVKKKGQRLSLSVNTDFLGTLRALQEHHSDNWIGPSLEAVWIKMAEAKRIFAFELWLHEEAAAGGSAEAKPPRLVAADFGHPHTHGLAYYVTTRFFDREFRTIQPGFILAFAEAECMRRAGFELWDLGGSDKSPMMSYKPQVAIEMGRGAFLRRLRECSIRADAAASPERPDDEAAGSGSAALPASQRRRLPLTDPMAAPPQCGERVPTGVVFADIGEEDLWGASVLQAQEDRLRSQQEAAKKAAKKVQKPSKATRKKDPAKKDTAPAAQTAEAAPPPPPQEEKAKPAEEGGAEVAKALAKQRFMAVFQELLAKGVPQQEAAAKALQIVSCR